MAHLCTEHLDSIIAALEWAGRSPHHPNCKSRKANYNCDCHVGAAQSALPNAKTAKGFIASPDLREAAHDEYGTDECEIDDEPAISPADNGTWVAAWVWVASDDEGECGQCEGTGTTQSASNGEEEQCPVCDGTGTIGEEG